MEGIRNTHEKIIYPRNVEKEERFFGVALPEGSPLLGLYEYFSIEDMESIDIQFDGKGFAWTDLNLIESADVFEAIKPELVRLSEFVQRYKAIGQYPKSGEIMNLIKEYADVGRNINAKI